MTHNTSFGDIKRQILQDQRQALLEEYQAANAQLARTFSDVERVRLERELRDLEQRIARTEADLAALDQPTAADSSQDAITPAVTLSPPPRSAETATAPTPTTPAEDETTGRGGWFSRLPDAGKAAFITGVFAVIVAFISVVADVISEGDGPTPTPPQPYFAYQVRVRSNSGGQAISNAKVTIEVPGMTPVDELSDSNGLAVISILATHEDGAGKLIVEAAGFDIFRQNITLRRDLPPEEVMLSPIAPADRTNSVTPIPRPQAIVTSPTLDVRYGPYQPDPLQTPPPVITVAAQGDTFEITGKDQPTPAWWQVSILGQSGWVSGTLVTTQGAAQDVPVMTAVVALRTYYGNYVTAWNDEFDVSWGIWRQWKLWGGDATSILAWENFALQCEPDGSAVFHTDHGRYVTAMDDSDNWDWVLRAETGRLGASERFTLLDAQTKTPLPCLEVIRQAGQNDVAIIVQSTHGRYVTAMNGETGGDWRIRTEEPGETRAEQIFTLIKQN